MYILVTTKGVELGVTEEVRYIKRSDNGSFVRTDKEDAIGVAYDSQPYNLLGHEEIEGADTVIVKEADINEIISRRVAQIMESIAASGGDEETTGEEYDG